MQIKMTPAEIRAHADKIVRVFTEHALDGDPSETLGVYMTRPELLAELHESVTIACGLDQVGQEFDLMLDADAALNDALTAEGEEEGE